METTGVPEMDNEESCDVLTGCSDLKMTSRAGVSLTSPRRESDSIFAECWQSHYAEHFLETLRSKEASRPIIRLASPQLKYRAYLIMRMRRASSRLELGGRVLHGAVRFLDLFMDSHEIHSDLLLHVALVCLLIAAKFEMKGIRVIRFADLCDVSHTETISPDALWGLEWNVLQHLRWDLCSPTAATFMEFFGPAAVTRENHEHWCMEQKINSSFEKYQHIVKIWMWKFLNLTLLDMRFAKMTPSLVAAACVHGARFMLGLTNWPDYLVRLTSHPFSTVRPLSTRLSRMESIKDQRSSRKRDNYSESTDDQGYVTEESSRDNCKRPRCDSVLSL